MSLRSGVFFAAEAISLQQEIASGKEQERPRNDIGYWSVPRRAGESEGAGQLVFALRPSITVVAKTRNMLVHSSIMNGCLGLEGATRKVIPAEPQKSVDTTTRKPLFLFLLSGLFLLR